MNDFDLVFKQAKHYVDEIGYKDLLIMGDFNFPSIQWANGYIVEIKNENGVDHKFNDILSETFL